MDKYRKFINILFCFLYLFFIVTVPNTTENNYDNKVEQEIPNNVCGITICAETDEGCLACCTYAYDLLVASCYVKCQ